MESLPSFSIPSKNWLQYKTLISQELLKSSILGSNVFYPSTKHSDNLLKKYFQTMNKIFKTLKLCEAGKLDINKVLLILVNRYLKTAPNAPPVATNNKLNNMFRL